MRGETVLTSSVRSDSLRLNAMAGAGGATGAAVGLSYGSAGCGVRGERGAAMVSRLG